MGCDIHGVWQARVRGAWIDVPSQWDQSRDYLLFAWLADMRNHFGADEMAPIVAAPRGIPGDFQIDGHDHPVSSMEELRRIDPDNIHYHDQDDNDSPNIWLGDYSHSWVSADEILASTPRTKAGSDQIGPFNLAERLGDFITETKRLKDLHGDVRLVFGFDA